MPGLANSIDPSFTGDLVFLLESIIYRSFETSKTRIALLKFNENQDGEPKDVLLAKNATRKLRDCVD